MDISAADISGGLEAVPVLVCAEKMPGRIPPMFAYLKSNVVHNMANLKPGSVLASRGETLACVYTREGCLQPDFLRRLMSSNERPLYIRECWDACKCLMPCPNRVVQKGMKYACQVFWTCTGKGWGIRPSQSIPCGSFVFEFIGEILTNGEMDSRLIQSLRAGKKPEMLNVALDADLEVEEQVDENMPLCLDATFQGNVSRFLNHRCGDANLIDVPVLIESDALHYYHVHS